MDTDDLIKENERLKQIIAQIDLYQESKLRRVFGNICNEEVIAISKDIIFSHEELRSRIFSALGNDFLKDDFSFSVLMHGTLIGNYSMSATLYNKEEDKLKDDDDFIISLSTNSSIQMILLSDIYDSMSYSRIFYFPIVSAMYAISDIIEKRIINNIDSEAIVKKHNSAIMLNLLPYIREALNSLESTIVLFTRKSYTQAAIAMRTFIEEFIVIATLSHFPNTIEKFLFHNELKVKEELEPKKYKKEIDEYLKSQDINPDNLTLRSKYIDYGWMDEIESFASDKSKKMYKPKTMSRLIGLENYYEWYADLSNYVHSNFLYLRINWSKFLNLQIERLADITIKLIDLYSWLTGYDFNYKGIDVVKYFSDLSKAYNMLMKVTEYNFEMEK